MRLLIFGATGATGHCLVECALRLGHSVSAFVRDPSRLQCRHPRLLAVVGDVMHTEAADRAMAGHDGVLCALGTLPERPADRMRRQPGVPVCSVGTAHIVAAMTRHGVRRIVVESAASVGSSLRDGRLGSGHIVRLALRSVMADKERQEQCLRASGVDWTLVRPVRLRARPATGRLLHGDALAWHIGSMATHADVADFMLAALTDTDTVRRAITVRQ